MNLFQIPMRHRLDNEEVTFYRDPKKSGNAVAQIETALQTLITKPGKRKRIYISGPISTGNIAHNMQQAMRAAVQLIKEGYAPLCPHLTNQIDPGGIFPHETWIDVDLPWVLVSDAVLRLPGESKGADEEVRFARQNNIPVYDHLQNLLRDLSCHS